MRQCGDQPTDGVGGPSSPALGSSNSRLPTGWRPPGGVAGVEGAEGRQYDPNLTGVGDTPDGDAPGDARSDGGDALLGDGLAPADSVPGDPDLVPAGCINGVTSGDHRFPGDGLSHDLVRLSLGAISAVEARVSDALESPAQEAWAVVDSAPVKHADATSWLQSGKLRSLWTIATKVATVSRIVVDGSAETIKPFFGACRGILVSDRGSVFSFWTMARRQICWAHLLRKLISFSERDGPAGKFGREEILALVSAHARDGSSREAPTAAAKTLRARHTQTAHLDRRYTTPEQRARTVTILGGNKPAAAHTARPDIAGRVTAELIARGYDILGGGNAGVIGVIGVIGVAAERAWAANRQSPTYPGVAPGENLVLDEPAGEDAGSSGGRRIGTFATGPARLQQLGQASDTFLVFPGDASTLVELATLVANNKYRHKDEPAKRVLLVGREFFAGQQLQYEHLAATGILGCKPSDLFTVVDSAEEILAQLPVRRG